MPEPITPVVLTLLVLLGGFVVVAAASVLGRRLGIASPLLLVALGVAVSLVPMFNGVRIEPGWILEGVLPPLLYASAVSLPTMNFRREFSAISGLSVVLVVGTALLLGVFFHLVIPGLDFWWGVALGAIISPTDAVATGIVKGASVSKRVVAILEGESLLNDATALVLLRTAIVAVAASFSVWGAVGSFAYSVAVALVIGWLVGWSNLVARRRVTDPATNTVISFAAPFAASIPAELLGASGLVAAVVAGLVTGVLAPQELSPRNRLSDSQNWRTVELVLEGGIFLAMGLQIASIVRDVQDGGGGIAGPVLIALGALVITLVVRALYVAFLLGGLSLRARGAPRLQGRLQDMRQKLDTPEGAKEAYGEVNRRRRPPSERQLRWFASRVTRGLADMDYFLAAPLGWREGTAVVWAGMRGAVTVAAAQTLPGADEGGPDDRSTLVLVAFTVAAVSLLAQGATIGPLLRRLRAADAASVTEQQLDAERTRVMHLLRERSAAVPEPEAPEHATRRQWFEAQKRYRLAVLAAQRDALLDARSNGTFDADLLADVLRTVDADQIAIELRGTVPDGDAEAPRPQLGRGPAEGGVASTTERTADPAR